MRLRKPLYLTADKGTATPAINPPADLPTHHTIVIGGERRKVPLAYFWKDAISVGRYRHPLTGQRLAVNTARIDRWVAKFNRMKAAGVEVPTPVDHSDDAEDNRGFVVAARRHGVTLQLLHQAIGKKAAVMASRNRCSVLIDPDYHDGNGKAWGEAIVHSAYTPKPVVHGHGEFVPFAASRATGGRRVPRFYLASGRIKIGVHVNPDHLAIVRERLHLDDSMEPHEVVRAAVEHLAGVGELAKPNRGTTQSAARAAATMLSRANLKRFLLARAKKAERRGADTDELSAIRAETESWARRYQAGGAVGGPDPLEVAAEQLDQVQRLTDDCGLSHADAVKMLRDVDAKNARHQTQRETTPTDQGIADPFNVLGLTPMGRMMLSTVHVPNATTGGAVHGFSAKIS